MLRGCRFYPEDVFDLSVVLVTQVQAAKRTVAGLIINKAGHGFNPHTKNLDSQSFDSVRFLILRGGIPRSMVNCPEV